MSRQQTRRASAQLEAALKRMPVDFTVHKSNTSASAYFRVRGYGSIILVHIRIADHPPYADTESLLQGKSTLAVLWQIGNKPWADFEFDEWYMCLDAIASKLPCVEIRQIATKIIAEERAKRTTRTEAFEQVRQNIAAKALQKQRNRLFGASEKMRRKTRRKNLRQLAGVEKIVRGICGHYHIQLIVQPKDGGTLFQIIRKKRNYYLFAGSEPPAAMPDDSNLENTAYLGLEDRGFKPGQWMKAIKSLFRRTGHIPKEELHALIDRFSGGNGQATSGVAECANPASS